MRPLSVAITTRSPKAPADDIKRFYRGLSMAGIFRPGDLLFFEPVPIARLRRGDIVAYSDSQPPPEGVDTVHRVVAITSLGLICRGDNNRSPDRKPVTEERLIGRVSRFERGGRVHEVRGGRAGMRQACLTWARRAVLRMMSAPLRPLYRRLRRSGLVPLLWKPDIRRVRFCSPDGDYIKYIRRGRTVAVCRLAGNEIRFRRPYDLVLWKKFAREWDQAVAKAHGPKT